MDTTYRKNLKAVLTASKDYTDNSIEKLKWELGTYDLSVTTDSTVAYTKTIPTNAIKGRLNYIGGASKVSENLILEQKQVNVTAGSEKWLQFNVNVENGQTYTLANYEPTKSNEVWQCTTTGYQNFTTEPKTFTASTSIITIRCGANNLASAINYQSKIMLVKGSTAPTEFSVGFENIRNAKTTSVVVSGTDVSPITKAIPQEVLNDVRYGLGFSDTQFNKLDLITKHLTGEWNIVDLGTLNWNVDGDHLFSTTINLAKNSAICVMGSNQYTLDTNVTITDKEYRFGGSSNTFYVRDYSISTTSDFKTAMSGVYLLYQTETQFDVDFSQYIDDDFKNIDTTNMATITFENEFEYDVPSEIDYLIEEVKA